MALALSPLAAGAAAQTTTDYDDDDNLIDVRNLGAGRARVLLEH